jgi:hypothetical protein
MLVQKPAYNATAVIRSGRFQRKQWPKRGTQKPDGLTQSGGFKCEPGRPGSKHSTSSTTLLTLLKAADMMNY